VAYGPPGRGRLAPGLPREAFRPSLVFLGILALFLVSGAMAWYAIGPLRLDIFVFVVSGWVVSLCLHEYAHAVAGYLSGDHSVAARGYLTLNPVKYTHPVLSIVLPLVFLVLGGIGLPGGAVWVDHAHIRGRARFTLISLAGPGVNVLFTLVLMIPFLLGVDVLLHEPFWVAWAFLAFLQLTASVLNLVPVPGVDGGNALRPWLSPQWQRGFDLVAPYGMLLFLALLWQPRIGGAFFALVDTVGGWLGLPPGLAAEGYAAFRFWS